MRKIEVFLRGEIWLHLVTMFFLMTILLKLIVLPIWLLVTIVGVVAIGWELFWKYKRQNAISMSDILGTIIGGILAILILKL